MKSKSSSSFKKTVTRYLATSQWANSFFGEKGSYRDGTARRLFTANGVWGGRRRLMSVMKIMKFLHFSTNMLSLLLSTVVPLAFGGSPIPTMKIGIDVNGKDVNLPMSGLGTWQ